MTNDGTVMIDLGHSEDPLALCYKVASMLLFEMSMAVKWDINGNFGLIIAYYCAFCIVMVIASWRSALSDTWFYRSKNDVPAYLHPLQGIGTGRLALIYYIYECSTSRH